MVEQQADRGWATVQGRVHEQRGAVHSTHVRRCAAPLDVAQKCFVTAANSLEQDVLTARLRENVPRNTRQTANRD